MAIPQLIITLTPDRAGLQAELPGANGSRRVIRLGGRGFEASCRRMLLALADAKVAIGLDGAPTQQQVEHWERHRREAPDSRCPFCRAEPGWLLLGGRQRPSGQHLAGDGSVRVRKLPGKGRAAPRGLKVKASLQELGL